MGYARGVSGCSVFGGGGCGGRDRSRQMVTPVMKSCVHKVAVLMMCVLVMADGVVGASSIVWSPTRAPTSDITCWTCNNKANNEECNNWAPDLKCPINHTVCQTVHRFSSPGAVSVQVTKRCVHATACSPQHVGCSQDKLTGQQECVSCCDYSYCNQEVPVNTSTALQLSSFTTNTPSAAATTSPPSPVSILFWIATSSALSAFSVRTLGTWTL